jgi:hypothetical protein
MDGRFSVGRGNVRWEGSGMGERTERSEGMPIGGTA